MDASLARCTSDRGLRGDAAAIASRLAMGVVLAASTIAPSPAWASGDDERAAAELKSRGNADMDSGAYADAVARYRASYQRRRDPALLYDLGTAYERLGDYPRALVYLEEFGRVAPASLRERVPALERIIEDARARVLRVDDPRPRAPDAPSRQGTQGSIVTRWWFWTGVGVVLVSGVAVAIALAQNHAASSGEAAPSQAAGPIFAW